MILALLTGCGQTAPGPADAPDASDAMTVADDPRGAVTDESKLGPPCKAIEDCQEGYCAIFANFDPPVGGRCITIQDACAIVACRGHNICVKTLSAPGDVYCASF